MPVEVGATLQVEGKTAGTVTSTAVGPHGAVALGYVRTSMLEGELMVGETAVDNSRLPVC